MVKITSLDERGIYTDLLRKFKNEGHLVSVVSPAERREKQKTQLKIDESGTSFLTVRTFNLQKTNIVEKGVGTLAMEYQFLSAIKKHFSKTKFHLVIYSTPPITFFKVIDFIKRRDDSYSYLLLKDIFPQNAVDMNYITKGGILHKMFLKKERELYEISDTIGCMSSANKKYILQHNPSVLESKVEVNPNSIYPIQTNLDTVSIEIIRTKYKLPLDKKIFVYGGNLGKPQGIDFLLEVIENTKQTEAFFLIIGAGTEYDRINKWFNEKRPKNAILLSGLPKNEYDKLLSACDIGLLFLNKNFTIPNFPSRLLSYLEMQKPIIAAVDSATDIGEIIVKNGCGFSLQSGDSNKMEIAIKNTLNEELTKPMKKKAWELVNKDFHVDLSYNLIISKIN